MSTNKSGSISKAVSYVSEVRNEVKKVTWPSRRETTLTTIFVFILAMVAAIYFTIVDQIVYKFVAFILGILS